MPNFALSDEMSALVHDNGLHQADVAKALCVLPGTVYKWLAPSNSTLRACPPYSAVELVRRMVASGELKPRAKRRYLSKPVSLVDLFQKLSKSQDPRRAAALEAVRQTIRLPPEERVVLAEALLKADLSTLAARAAYPVFQSLLAGLKEVSSDSRSNRETGH